MRLRAAARAPEEPSSALVPNPEYVTLKLAVFATCRVTFVRLPREKKSAFLCNTRTHTRTRHRLTLRDRCESGEIRRGRGAAGRRKTQSHTPPLSTEQRRLSPQTLLPSSRWRRPRRKADPHRRHARDEVLVGEQLLQPNIPPAPSPACAAFLRFRERARQRHVVVAARAATGCVRPERRLHLCEIEVAARVAVPRVECRVVLLLAARQVEHLRGGAGLDIEGLEGSTAAAVEAPAAPDETPSDRAGPTRRRPKRRRAAESAARPRSPARAACARSRRPPPPPRPAAWPSPSGRTKCAAGRRAYSAHSRGLGARVLAATSRLRRAKPAERRAAARAAAAGPPRCSAFSAAPARASR